MSESIELEKGHFHIWMTKSLYENIFNIASKTKKNNSKSLGGLIYNPITSSDLIQENQNNNNTQQQIQQKDEFNNDKASISGESESEEESRKNMYNQAYNDAKNYYHHDLLRLQKHIEEYKIKSQSKIDHLYQRIDILQDQLKESTAPNNTDNNENLTKNNKIFQSYLNIPCKSDANILYNCLQNKQNNIYDNCQLYFQQYQQCTEKYATENKIND